METLEATIIDVEVQCTGLLQMKFRATRHLHPGMQMSAVQLAEEERVRIDSHRTRFKRKLKMGRMLAAEELLNEAREVIGDAILSAAPARAPCKRVCPSQKNWKRQSFRRWPPVGEKASS